jgi:hypothetical protein
LKSDGETKYRRTEEVLLKLLLFEFKSDGKDMAINVLKAKILSPPLSVKTEDNNTHTIGVSKSGIAPRFRGGLTPWTFKNRKI